MFRRMWCQLGSPGLVWVIAGLGLGGCPGENPALSQLECDEMPECDGGLTQQSCCGYDQAGELTCYYEFSDQTVFGCDGRDCSQVAAAAAEYCHPPTPTPTPTAGPTANGLDTL